MNRNLCIIFLFITINCKAQSWYPLGSGLVGNNQFYDRVNTLCNDSAHNRLWTAGSFQIAGGDSVKDIAWWNGNDWHPLRLFIGVGDTEDYNFDAEISSSIMFHGKFIFSAAPIQNLFDRWRIYSYNVDSMKYVVIGTFNDRITAMEIYHDTLYVAGLFTDYIPDGMSSPITNLNGIAKWNGTDFVPVGLGNDGGEINALCVHNDHLIAGGFFEFMDGTYCKNISEWDGSVWTPIGNGIGTQWDYSVILHSVQSFQGKLYAGGNFNFAGTQVGQGLVFWNGTNWNSGGGLFGDVRCMKVNDNNLFIGGPCLFVGPVNNEINYFDGSVWNGMGHGPYDDVLSIENFNNEVYAGGKFKYVGDTPTYTYVGFVALYNPTYLFISDSINAGICEGDVYYFNGIQLSSTGIYYDTLISSTGIDSIVILTLNVTQLNSAINILNDTLTASGNGTVQWYDCNSNQIIIGATNNIYVASTAGNYAAIISSGSCSDTTACVSYTGVGNQLAVDGWQLTITALNENNIEVNVLTNKNESAEMLIYNMQGQLIRSKNISLRAGANHFTEPAPYAQGMYLLQVRTKSEVRGVKFVVE